jgi:hypothetical protein
MFAVDGDIRMRVEPTHVSAIVRYFGPTNSAGAAYMTTDGAADDCWCGMMRKSSEDHSNVVLFVTSRL